MDLDDDDMMGGGSAPKKPPPEISEFAFEFRRFVHVSFQLADNVFPFVAKPLPVALEDLYKGTTKKLKITKKLMSGREESNVLESKPFISSLQLN